MTTDLDRLIEAVEAGWPILQTDLPPDYPKRLWVLRANDGSIDAAVLLLDALLPGWRWSLDCDGWAVAYPPCGKQKVFEAEIKDNPARALLLATLRAYRSMRKGG